jgi:hypothetical protein
LDDDENNECQELDRKRAKDREAWKLILKEVRVLRGAHSQRRERERSKATACHIHVK